MIKLNEFYVPELQNESRIFEPQIWRWFNNIPIEFEELFTQSEKEALLKYFETTKLLKYYKKENGSLKWWRRSFFRHHFSLNLTEAVNYLFSTAQRPKILDLGCGIGTQSILYAMLGAEVISVDLDPLALSLLKRRQQFYQQACERELNITIYKANALEFDYSTTSPLDGVFSMFAFNMMQPSTELLKKITLALRPGGRLVIFDGNRCNCVQKVFPGRCGNTLSPIQLSRQLRYLGFTIAEHKGGIAIPPLIWILMPTFILHPIDKMLTRSWFFSVSHQIFAERVKFNLFFS
jgi:SAM-dependent methyltransferase